MNAQTIKDFLTGENGYDYAPVAESIAVVRDPQVDGTFAVQFADEDGTTIQLLFDTGHSSGGTDTEILEETLEEVEYTSWPPTSGSLRFF